MMQCGNCGQALDPREVGIRHFGAYLAHAEGRCIQLLQFRISEQAREIIDFKAGWQPIETAPKDGTKLLLWDGGDMVVGHWDAPRRGGVWVDTIQAFTISATHWAALPAPPRTPVS